MRGEGDGPLGYGKGETRASIRQEADAVLLQRAVRREPAALGELYDIYLPRVYAFCLMATNRHREDAEDLTATVFERCLNGIGRYRDIGIPFSAWLLRIAANTIAERARQRHTRVMLIYDSTLIVEEVADESDVAPDSVIERLERADELLAQIAMLSDDQRVVLDLRYWQGMSFDMIAQRMGRSEPAARKLLFRAISALRVHMNAGGERDNNDQYGSRAVGDARGGSQRAAGTGAGGTRATHTARGTAARRSS